MTRSTLLVTAMAIAMAGSAALEAQAQDSFFVRDRYVSVADRSQPEFDPAPLRLGAFEANAKLKTGVGYQTNIFASSTNETEDTFFKIAPTVDVHSNWSRHELGLILSADSTQYVDTDSESATDLRARAYGGVDASTSLELVGAILAEKTNEPRSAAASNPLAAEPVEVDRTGGEVGANYEAGRIRLRGRLSAENVDYNDVASTAGPVLDQDFRDRDETTGSLRASYAPARDWAVFVEGVLTQSDYDTAPGALNRDSEGTILRVGSSFELPVLVRGDIAVGYHQYEYDDPSFSDVDGVSVEGNASWFVSELTTLSASASRRVVDPGLQGSAGATRTMASVRADHELRRNWLVNAEIGASNFNFEGINREDDRISLGLGSRWKLNRHAAFELTYEYADQDSNQQSFSDNRVLASITLYP